MKDNTVPAVVSKMGSDYILFKYQEIEVNPNAYTDWVKEQSTTEHPTDHVLIGRNEKAELQIEELHVSEINHQIFIASIRDIATSEVTAMYTESLTTAIRWCEESNTHQKIWGKILTSPHSLHPMAHDNQEADWDDAEQIEVCDNEQSEIMVSASRDWTFRSRHGNRVRSAEGDISEAHLKAVCLAMANNYDD